MYLRNMHVKKVFKSYPKLVILKLKTAIDAHMSP